MKNNSNKIEEILGSLDGSHRAVMPGFFYTRLKARMEKTPEPVKKSWMLRPAFALAALVAVLLINAVVILKGNRTSSDPTNDSEALQSIAAEYSLNDVTSVYDLNQDK